MITASGIGSGLDVESLVTQLVAVESRPLRDLQSRRSDIDVAISAHGRLKSAIDALDSAARSLSNSTGTGLLSASANDEATLTATALTSAVEGVYAIEIGQVAERHKLGSVAYADSATPIGSGSIMLSVAGSELTIDIDATNNTLSGLAAAVNAAVDNPGIAASVVTADDGAHLVLSSTRTGTANAIAVTSDPALAGLGLSEIRAPKDAVFSVDGFAVTRSSNVVSDVVSGLELTLSGPGATTLIVTSDNSAMNEQVEALVGRYNELRDTITNLRGGTLRGESLLTSLEAQIRTEFTRNFTGASGAPSYLFEVGLSFDRNGALGLDSSKLEDSIAANASGVSALFGDATDSLAQSLSKLLDAYTKSNGLIDSRIDGLEGRTRSIDRRIESFEYRLEGIESRYRKQFASLDSLLGRLQTTSSFLVDQLANLPGVGQRPPR